MLYFLNAQARSAAGQSLRYYNRLVETHPPRWVPARHAKGAADIVLLEKDLGVLVQGVREGRTTFANTLKYVFMATSANFGNMFSMAGVSLFLPFLPLLPKQILLTNLMTDFPEMTIATDRVDSEMVDHPRRWDIKAIRKFMITFGLVSSVFDYLTFGTLLLLSIGKYSDYFQAANSSACFQKATINFGRRRIRFRARTA